MFRRFILINFVKNFNFPQYDKITKSSKIFLFWTIVGHSNRESIFFTPFPVVFWFFCTFSLKYPLKVFFKFPISALEMLLNFAILNQSSVITVMSLVLCFNFQTLPKWQLLCSIAFSSGCIIYKILLKIFRIELMSLLLACYSL